jgi:hypothetical protein
VVQGIKVRSTQRQQQTCKACGQPDKMDFNVPDAIWKAAVPTPYQNRVVCLHCFDDFARERNVDYAASLTTLHFAGRGAAMEFKVVRSVSQLG